MTLINTIASTNLIQHEREMTSSKQSAHVTEYVRAISAVICFYVSSREGHHVNNETRLN